MFEEGYLRFTSLPYRLHADSIDNNYVHLTNHSLQKHSPNYSSSHSLQAMRVLQEALALHPNHRAYEHILSSIRHIIDIAMHATLGKNNKMGSKNRSFEIFGFDFLIDRELNVRLIEANCNPAITEDCSLLTQLIPKMLSTYPPTQTMPSN